MSTEIISTSKLEAIVLEALNNLMVQMADEGAGNDLGSRDSNHRLQREFGTLQQRTSSTDESGIQRFAGLVVTTVEAAHRLTPDAALALLRCIGTADLMKGGDHEGKVSSDWNNLPTSINTSGWDGRAWRQIAAQPHTPTKNSYIEMRENAKDVFVDFLQDIIKETLTNEALDFAVAQAKTVVPLVLGQGAVALLAHTPTLLAVLGFVLLFALSRFQSDAVDVPDDCICVWNRISRECETTGFAKLSVVIRSFRMQGLHHPRPHNLAPCDHASLVRVPSCPFRFPNQKGKSCCKLAYDTDPSFGTETRDDKIIRTFQKLENLGLIETKIDQSPDHYYLA